MHPKKQRLDETATVFNMGIVVQSHTTRQEKVCFKQNVSRNVNKTQKMSYYVTNSKTNVLLLLLLHIQESK